MNWRNRVEQRVRLRSLVCAPDDAAVKIAPKVRDSIAQGAALGTEAANNDHPNGVTFPVVGVPGNRAPLGLTTVDGGMNPGLRPGLWNDAASRLRRAFGPSITTRYHSLVKVGARFSRHLAVFLSPRRVVSRAAGASPRLCLSSAAAHFSGRATGAAVVPLRHRRACPGGALTDKLAGLKASPISFRFRFASAAVGGECEAETEGSGGQAILANQSSLDWGKPSRGGTKAGQTNPTRNHDAAVLRPCSSRRKSGSKHARPRDGYTLVELIVVISINSVLMAIAVGLLGVLMRSDQAARQHWTQTSAPARLAAQFRADVAGSQTATMVQGKAAAGANPPATAQPDVLRLQGPADHAIEFHRDGQSVRRIESHGAEVVRREAYMIPDLAGVDFQSRLSLRESSAPFAERKATVTRPAHGPFVSITLRLATADGGAETCEIIAQLAKDLRFAEAAQAQPEAAP